ADADFDACVPRGANVLQHAGIARRVRERPREKQVMRVLAIDVEAARDALIEDAVVETDIELVGRFPLEAGIWNRAWAERSQVVRAAGVPRPGQETKRLIGTDRAVADPTVAQAELEVGDAGDMLHERFVADLPAERRGGEEGELVPIGEHAGAVIPAGGR